MGLFSRHGNGSGSSTPEQLESERQSDTNDLAKGSRAGQKEPRYTGVDDVGLAFNRASLLAEMKEEAKAQYEEQLATMAEQYRQDIERLETKLQAALAAAQQQAEEAAEQQLAAPLCGRCSCLLAEERAAEVEEAAAGAAADLVAGAMRQASEAIAEISVNPTAWAAEQWHDEPEPELAGFVPIGLYFATRCVVLREFAATAVEENPKVGQLEAGEVVYVSECEITEQHGTRLYCRGLVNTAKEGWASMVLRRDRGTVLLQRVARPANMPVLGQTYVAKQRVPVRDRAEVSSARIGWLEAGDALHVTYVRMDDTDVGRPKVLANDGWVSFWNVSDDRPVFELLNSDQLDSHTLDDAEDGGEACVAAQGCQTEQAMEAHAVPQQAVE